MSEPNSSTNTDPVPLPPAARDVAKSNTAVTDEVKPLVTETVDVEPETTTTQITVARSTPPVITPAEAIAALSIAEESSSAQPSAAESENADRIPVRADQSCAEQMPPGNYFVFTETETLLNGPTFLSAKAHFCTNPYQTCTDPTLKALLPEGSTFILKASCHVCFGFMNTLIPALSEFNLDFNLVHWGPNNDHHGCLVGPVPSDNAQVRKLIVQINRLELQNHMQISRI